MRILLKTNKFCWLSYLSGEFPVLVSSNTCSIVFTSPRLHSETGRGCTICLCVQYWEWLIWLAKHTSNCQFLHRVLFPQSFPGGSVAGSRIFSLLCHLCNARQHPGLPLYLSSDLVLCVWKTCHPSLQWQQHNVLTTQNRIHTRLSRMSMAVKSLNEIFKRRCYYPLSEGAGA